jgi:hypothetical protein
LGSRGSVLVAGCRTSPGQALAYQSGYLPYRLACSKAGRARLPKRYQACAGGPSVLASRSIITNFPSAYALAILAHTGNSGDGHLPQRQNPAPGVHINLGQSNIVLLTITTERRVSWLTNATAHRLLHETWSEAKARLVGDYPLMRDPFHAFCAPDDLNFTIEQWIAYWKRQFRLRHRQEDWKFQS